ncbi:MAG: ATP-binding protein [Polyangiaceae bacterium]
MNDAAMTADDILAPFERLGLAAVTFERTSATLLASTTAARALLGESAEYLDEWLRFVHPSDRAPTKERIADNRSGSLTVRLTSDNTRFRPLHFELRPLGALTFALVTEPALGAGEAKLNALLHALPFEVWERDEEGVLVNQNVHAQKHWDGYLGNVIDDLPLLPDTLLVWKDMIARAMRGETVRMPHDYIVGGVAVSRLHVLAPVRDGERIRGIVGVNIDVTAIKRIEAKLALAQETLVKAERLAALGELAAVVAHEVRNPLASIFNSLSSLKRQLTLDGDAAILFGILQEEAERLNRTVADLLSYVRPLEPERRPEDLVELARDALRQGMHTLPPGRPPIDAEVVAPASIPSFLGDPVLLRIAFVNLIVNAVQAMPEGGKLVVELSCTHDKERDAIVIDVHDTGKGIPQDAIGRVFEPFFTTRASGTGLGLALVRRIVEAHDGTVRAASDPRSGARFTIILPR